MLHVKGISGGQRRRVSGEPLCVYVDHLQCSQALHGEVCHHTLWVGSVWLRVRTLQCSACWAGAPLPRPTAMLPNPPISAAIAVGIELVKSPRVLFLDEPSSAELLFRAVLMLPALPSQRPGRVCSEPSA